MPSIKMRNSLTLKPLLGTKKVVPIDPDYFDKFTAQTIIRTLDELPSSWPLDLFEGEAEIFLFDPLYRYLQALLKRRNNGTSALDDIPLGSSLTTFVFTEAVDWACVSEFISLQQTKIQSQDLTFKTIKTQPFYKALIAADPAASLAEFTSDIDGQIQFNEHLMELLKPTSLEIINSLAKAAIDRTHRAEVAEDAYQETLRSKFKLVLDWTKKGKGPVAIPDARDRILATRMQTIQIIRDLLAPTAGYTPSLVTGATTHDFHEGLLASILLLEYFKSIEDYDTNWPEQSFQGLAQAWIMTMQAKATDLAGKWMTHHTDSVAYDLYRAQMVLDLATTPYIEPLDRYFKSWKDDMAAYYHTMSEFVDTVPDYIKFFPHEALSRQKTFVGDNELVADLSNSLDSIRTLIKETLPHDRTNVDLKWDDEKTCWLLNGTPITSKTTDFPFLSQDQVGEPEIYSPAKKFSINRAMTQKILYLIYQKQETLMSAIESVNAIKNIHTLLYGRDVLIVEKSNLSSDIWKTLPLVGGLQEAQIAPFHPVDPISRITIPWYCDWANGELSIKWKGLPFLYRVVNPHPINQALMDTVPNSWTWDKVGLPVTDAITQPFTNVVLPVAFTQTRRRSWQPYLMSSWLILSQSKEGIHDDLLQLQSAATAIEQLEGEFGQSVTNHLIGNMLVYKLNDSKYELVTPTIPAVYGVPLDEFIEAQVLERRTTSNIESATSVSTKKKLSSTLITGDDIYSLDEETVESLRSQDMARIVKLRNQIQGIVKYAFVLLTRYPKPRKTTVRLWEYRPKIFLPISIMQDYVTPDVPWIVSEDTFNSLKKTTEWLPPYGWSDLVGPGLHFNNKCEPLAGAWDYWNEFREAQVYMSYDFSGRSVSFRSYLTQSVYVYDEDDRVKALSMTDPDLSITKKEIVPHDELVMKATLKAHFLDDPNKKPDRMAPRVAESQIRADLRATCFDAIINLAKDGQIELIGGQVDDESLAAAILKGSAFIGEMQDKPALSIDGDSQLDEAEKITVDNAGTTLSTLQQKARRRKSKPKEDVKAKDNTSSSDEQPEDSSNDNG